MGRPGKIIVDYFPHVTQSGKTLAALESRWGNDGYAFWFKLLELIGSTSGFCYNCNSPADWEYLLAKTRVSEEIAVAILDKLAELDAIDAGLWRKEQIWSDNFVSGVAAAFEKRKGALPQKPDYSGAEISQTTTAATFTGPETGKGDKNNVEDRRKDQNRNPPQPSCPSQLREGVAPLADTVFLKPEESARLAKEFGEAGLLRLVEILDGYKSNQPGKCREYRNDYKVIRSWVVNRYREERGLLAKTNRASPSQTTFIDKLALMARQEQPEERSR